MGRTVCRRVVSLLRNGPEAEVTPALVCLPPRKQPAQLVLRSSTLLFADEPHPFTGRLLTLSFGRCRWTPSSPLSDLPNTAGFHASIPRRRPGPGPPGPVTIGFGHFFVPASASSLPTPSGLVPRRHACGGIHATCALHPPGGSGQHPCCCSRSGHPCPLPSSAGRLQRRPRAALVKGRRRHAAHRPALCSLLLRRRPWAPRAAVAVARRCRPRPTEIGLRQPKRSARGGTSFGLPNPSSESHPMPLSAPNTAKGSRRPRPRLFHAFRNRSPPGEAGLAALSRPGRQSPPARQPEDCSTALHSQTSNEPPTTGKPLK